MASKDGEGPVHGAGSGASRAGGSERSISWLDSLERSAAPVAPPQIRIGITTPRVSSSSGGETRAGESSSWNEKRISFEPTAPMASRR